MVTAKRLLVLGVAISISHAALGQTAWKTFESTQRFSVRYPASWLQMDVPAGNLSIISGSERAIGVIIAKNEAMIFVREIHDYLSDEELIEEYARDDQLLIKKDVPLIERARQGCAPIKEAVFRDEVVPSKPEYDHIETAMFCRIGVRRFEARLENWEGDQRQADYQKIEQQMVESIRMR